MTSATPPSATEIAIPTDAGQLPGLLWLPPGGGDPVAGIVVLQEIFGLSDYILGRCRDLAEQGYAVLAPQLFARLDPPIDAMPEDEDPQAWIGAGMELAKALPWERAEADALAALEALRGRPEVDSRRTALLGFCYGGGLAFSAAAAASRQGRVPAALVSFYGSALPGLLELAEDVTVPSLHIFGTADAFIPLESVERIREAVTAGGTREQIRFELYEGAGHAFDNPHPALHHPDAAPAAWLRTARFLAEVLAAQR